MLLLIHPPVVKPSEPPPGIAALAGMLQRRGVPFTLLDANLEGLLWFMDLRQEAADPWSRRAFRNRGRNLAALRSIKTYQHIDRYKRAVADLNRVLERQGSAAGVRLSLANYQHPGFSPARSADLIRAAQEPEANPFFPYFADRLATLVEKEHISEVGVSLNYLSQALCTFAMAGFLRTHYPRLKIILGGGLVTSWLRRPEWLDPFRGLADCMVAGSGERELLSFLGIGDGQPIPALPQYESLPLDDYLAPGRIIPYATSRGCYWNRCSFCPERSEGNPYLSIPAPQVIKELRTLTVRLHPVLIHMVDNALSPALLKALAASPPGTPWYGFARVTPQLADTDFCASLKRSGCVLLKLGLESGDQEVLNRLGKGIDLDTASRALQALRRAGIATYGYFIFGTPSEGLESARKTLAFVVSHCQDLDFLNLAIFNLPLYGADAAAVETRTFYDGDLSLYADFVHPQGWDRRAVRQFLDREFKRHPAVAAILRKDPPLFTSNHAALFPGRTE